ncbi:MAG: cytochrome ubiquinol oxidase subunit I [Bacteroidales bacterium]|nr:cytochrome ubiquinol oxidase subunit I [Bacteroidales bacterium]MBN2819736.1 cytochrome ubiquinol oxidase subunit I [Bacteroidales bacterium]
MFEQIDLSLVNWSRAQFALTAIYHWLFVPLTLGISFIIAFMETIYVRTGNEEWKRITKFWMTLFGINFAIGVATGIILEFEFGTNWSNYSWFVGDIFGAPLAIEGIMAFFMESTFIAIMFFGWTKVSKKVHLTATWLTAIGANLSALWILVANGWMQNPVGMWFNPETARNEMLNFWEVLFSPSAASKFTHTTSSGFVLAALFVIGISSWFLLKKREINLAKKSILVASIFGIISSLYLIGSGDFSAKAVAHTQPMKLAAMEGLFEGTEQAPLLAFGILTKFNDEEILNNEDKFILKMEVPFKGFLSYMIHGDFKTFVPGVKDLVHGNPEYNIMSFQEKIERGYHAQQVLKELLEVKDKNSVKFVDLYSKFQDPVFLNDYFKYFGYGAYYDEDPEVVKNTNVLKLIPNIPLTFYAFHTMVLLGMLFLLIFVVYLYFVLTQKLQNKKWLYIIGIISIPLAYLASQAGWIVAEVGRQPWVIQDLMPTLTAVTKISASSVKVTFLLFSITFTALLIAELKIMFTQIKKGPSDH